MSVLFLPRHIRDMLDMVSDHAHVGLSRIIDMCFLRSACVGISAKIMLLSLDPSPQNTGPGFLDGVRSWSACPIRVLTDDRFLPRKAGIRHCVPLSSWMDTAAADARLPHVYRAPRLYETPSACTIPQGPSLHCG